MRIERHGHRYVDVESGSTIDAWFPAANRSLPRGCLAARLGFIRGEPVTCAIESLDLPPGSTEDAYLRLHLLSERTVAPNRINLDGIFTLLPIVAWTSAGPVFPAR
ncbi:MAG: tetrahydrodipicolinate succinyltransferase, partial [Burkholderiaceae bacterium]